MQHFKCKSRIRSFVFALSKFLFPLTVLNGFDKVALGMMTINNHSKGGSYETEGDRTDRAALLIDVGGSGIRADQPDGGEARR